MSLFNSLVQTALQSALGGNSETAQNQTQNIVQGVVNMLQSDSVGGVEGLVNKFKASGLGDVVSSWVGTGENKSVSPEQVVEVLGQEQVDELAQQAGIPEEKGASVLSQILPSIIDKFTPGGEILNKENLGTVAKVVLGGVGVALAAKAAASAFGNKEEENVNIPASTDGAAVTQSIPTAAPAASAAANNTYVVVSGDSLSRIAKHFYGDANQWPRIFEANAHVLKDPNRIFPGQVLNIP